VSTFPLVMVQLGVEGREVAGAMVSRHFKRFPLSQDGKIVGVVTARDLVRAYAGLPHEIEDPLLAEQAAVRYGEVCPICNSRIDSTGLCGCGAGGA
jgi:predicted transcriptional regulator